MLITVETKSGKVFEGRSGGFESRGYAVCFHLIVTEFEEHTWSIGSLKSVKIDLNG